MSGVFCGHEDRPNETERQLLHFFATTQHERTAEHLHTLGLGPADAAHVAFAELAECDFVTVDDCLLRQLRRVRTSVWFGAPAGYCDKEDLR